MRGTLHLLVPEDLARIVVASGTRERWREAVWQKAFGITFEQVEAMIAAVGATLSDEPMLRADLADAVADHLSDPALKSMLRSGWGSFLGPVAQRGLLCFGPPAGRNVTFVRPSAWLGRPISPEELAAATARKRGDVPLVPIEALGSLVRSFLAAFPGSGRDATVRWWGAMRAGLINDARAVLGDDVVDIDVAGTKAWALPADVKPLEATRPFEGVRLLPGFDPWINELPRRTMAVMDPVHHDRIYRVAGWVTPVVIVDGRVAGTWELARGQARRDHRHAARTVAIRREDRAGRRGGPPGRIPRPAAPDRVGRGGLTRVGLATRARDPAWRRPDRAGVRGPLRGHGGRRRFR